MEPLEARWLWLQERVDTTLNSADQGTKFHPRRRFDELLMMLPLRVGLMTSLGAREHRTERDTGDASLTSFFPQQAMYLLWHRRSRQMTTILATVFVLGEREGSAALLTHQRSYLTKAQPVPWRGNFV